MVLKRGALEKWVRCTVYGADLSHHGAPVAHVAEGPDGANAAPVELHAAADAVRPAAQDHDASAIAFHCSEQVPNENHPKTRDRKKRF